MSLNDLSLDELKTKIEELNARISCMFIDEDMLKRYQILESNSKNLSKDLNDITEEKEILNNKLNQIKNVFEPKLKLNISKISQNFSQFFNYFNSLGKIELETNPLYELWKLNIFAKFRKNETEMRLLSGLSHSGGEKSLATMLYLLSLQCVSTVPFRVVDEINQGVDDKNERLLMNVLNQICIPKSKKSNTIPQYFVITPNLLPGLVYSKYSTVFIVCNGPFQIPQDLWNIEKFMDSQRQTQIKD